MNDFHLAEQDYLTGLNNRRGLYEYYETLQGGDRIHAMFIDIDNFKRVNDIYGHSHGDELLIAVSKLIRQNASGFTSRIGGDEYVVLFDGSISHEELTKLAEKMLLSVPHMDFRKDSLSLISLSIGIVFDQNTTQSLDDILKKCDAAMYQAKYNGKNRYAVYHGDDAAFDISRSIETEMESALSEGQFQVYLQPKVNMVTMGLYGAEALSRWIHPKEGLRAPALYIEIFERNGFISKLDMYVFEEVCRMKKSWRGEKYEHVPISINMSRLHLFNDDYPAQLSEIADRYDIPHNELEIEITEGIFIKDSRELIRMVDLLKARDFLVSIDDFGSGFSALNLLKDIPVDTIKLDKEFLQISSGNMRGKKVIRNILAMCRDLKLDVVTEGIETRDQSEFIISCGCPIAQGFLYSKPIPEPEFRKFADEYMTNTLDCFSFRLNGNLKSEDGSKEGTINGEGLVYEQGLFTDSKSLYFPGGDTEKNDMYLPADTIIGDSYTISMWIMPRKNRVWSAALYVKFESGFCAIIPLSPDSHSDYRIRDSKEINGWYDLPACQLRENEWAQYTITYNAKTERAVSFINGEVVMVMDNVPTNRFVKWIIVGGDVFQPSFNGNICEIMIYNECKDYDFVQQLHLSYTERPDFMGFYRT